eukprot:gene12639-12768_t
METAAVAAVKQSFTAFAGGMWIRIKTGQQSERRRTTGVVSANSKRQQRGSKKQHLDTVKNTDNRQGGGGSHSKNFSTGGNISSSYGGRGDGKEAVGSWLSDAVQRPWQSAQVKRQEATVTPSMSSTASPAASTAKQSTYLGRASSVGERERSRTRSGKSAGPKRAPGVSQGCQQPSAGDGIGQEADVDIGSGGTYQIKASKDTLQEQRQDNRDSLPAAKSHARPQQLAGNPAAQLQSKAVAQASAGLGVNTSWANTAAALTSATPTSSNAGGHRGQVASAAPAGAPDNAAVGQMFLAAAATTPTDVQLAASSDFTAPPGRDHHKSGTISRDLSNAVQALGYADEGSSRPCPMCNQPVLDVVDLAG